MTRWVHLRAGCYSFLIVSQLYINTQSSSRLLLGHYAID